MWLAHDVTLDQAASCSPGRMLDAAPAGWRPGGLPSRRESPLDMCAAPLCLPGKRFSQHMYAAPLCLLSKRFSQCMYAAPLCLPVKEVQADHLLAAPCPTCCSGGPSWLQQSARTEWGRRPSSRRSALRSSPGWWGALRSTALQQARRSSSGHLYIRALHQSWATGVVLLQCSRISRVGSGAHCASQHAAW